MSGPSQLQLAGTEDNAGEAGAPEKTVFTFTNQTKLRINPNQIVLFL